MNYKNNKGQSLVEAVVAIGLVTLVLVALISAITFSLANAQYSRNKSIATKYAQEAIEAMRKLRDAGWPAFYTWANDTTGRTYCMTNTFTLTNIPPACVVIDDTYDIFTRTVKLVGNGGTRDRVSVQVVVTWTQGTRTPNVTLDTYLTKVK